MAKIRNPKLFSEEFGINPQRLGELGTFNPILNADTRLFLDPMLIRKSAAPELTEAAWITVTKHFTDLHRLLRASQSAGDIAWKQASKLMTYREMPATCLGYGGASVRGSGMGIKRRMALVERAKRIVELGVTDPELFLLLPLLEEGIGPDLISDMTTTIIAADLAQYTRRILQAVAPAVPLHPFSFRHGTEQLPKNPFYDHIPVLLVPTDTLDALPITSDWADVASAAAKNETLRNRLNEQIGELWLAVKKPDAEIRADLRRAVLSSPETLDLLLRTVKAAPRSAYNFTDDPEGHRVWLEGRKVAAESPKALHLDTSATPDEVWQVISMILEQFRFLVEDRGISRLLWRNDSKHHVELVAQLLFFVIADSYCRANNLDLTPEADTGRGTVDFKISLGYSQRYLVEIKLSTNPKIVAGFDKQLATYALSESAVHSAYVIVDVGGLGDKWARLSATRNALLREGKAAPDVLLIDGQMRLSASKL